MKIKRIEHVAIAVRDMDATGRLLTDLFGMQPTLIEELPEHSTKLAMFPVGDSSLELLEGTSAAAGCAKWIAERGESLYHICLEVDDIDGALAELKAKGVALLNDEPMLGHGGCRIAFIDPGATGQILFELAEMPAGGH